MAKLLEYEHCGRTVLLREEEGQAAVWVEGESPGTCPLREIDLFAAGPADKATLAAVESTAMSNATLQVGSFLEKVPARLPCLMGRCAV